MSPAPKRRRASQASGLQGGSIQQDWLRWTLIKGILPLQHLGNEGKPGDGVLATQPVEPVPKKKPDYMMLCLRSGGFHRSFFIHPSGNICSKIEHLQGLDKLPWPLRPQQEGRLDHDQRVHGVLSQDQPKGPHFHP